MFKIPFLLQYYVENWDRKYKVSYKYSMTSSTQSRAVSSDTTSYKWITNTQGCSAKCGGGKPGSRWIKQKLQPKQKQCIITVKNPYTRFRNISVRLGTDFFLRQYLMNFSLCIVAVTVEFYMDSQLEMLKTTQIKIGLKKWFSGFLQCFFYWGEN